MLFLFVVVLVELLVCYVYSDTVLYTSPTASPSSTDCTITSPCDSDNLLLNVNKGDENKKVIFLEGDYFVEKSFIVTTAVDLEFKSKNATITSISNGSSFLVFSSEEKNPSNTQRINLNSFTFKSFKSSVIHFQNIKKQIEFTVYNTKFENSKILKSDNSKEQTVKVDNCFITGEGDFLIFENSTSPKIFVSFLNTNVLETNGFSIQNKKGDLEIVLQNTSLTRMNGSIEILSVSKTTISMTDVILEESNANFFLGTNFVSESDSLELRIQNSVIQKNTGEYGIMSFYLGDGGLILSDLQNNVIQQNYCLYGGAIKYESYGPLNISHSNNRFINNSQSGAIKMLGLKKNEKDHIIFQNEYFEGNQIIDELLSTASQGGAIKYSTGYLKRETIFKIKDSVFKKNYAGKISGSTIGSGGALSFTSKEFSSIDITNSKFIENRAQYGGVFHIETVVSEWFISGCEFTKNIAKNIDSFSEYEDGGVIFVDYFKGEEPNLLSNESYLDITIKNSTFKENEARFGSIFFNQFGNDLVLKVANSKFLKNHADFYGGVFVLHYGIAVITDSIFDNNEVSSNMEGTSYGSYGAVFFCFSSSVVIRNCEFTNNNATEYGGVFYLMSSDEFFLENSLVESNYAKYGGSLYLLNGERIILKASEFKYNSADYGGAFYIDNFDSSQILFKMQTTIHNNSANVAGGGAYFSNTNLDAFVIPDTILFDNYAPNGPNYMSYPEFIKVDNTTHSSCILFDDSTSLLEYKCSFSSIFFEDHFRNLVKGSVPYSFNLKIELFHELFDLSEIHNASEIKFLVFSSTVLNHMTVPINVTFITSNVRENVTTLLQFGIKYTSPWWNWIIIGVFSLLTIILIPSLIFVIIFIAIKVRKKKKITDKIYWSEYAKIEDPEKKPFGSSLKDKSYVKKSFTNQYNESNIDL